MKTRRFFFGLLFYNKTTCQFVEVHGDIDHYDFVGAKEAIVTYGLKVLRDSKSKNLTVLPPVITEAVLVA